MSISTVITFGYGSFGSVTLLPPLGFTAGAPSPPVVTPGPFSVEASCVFVVGGGPGVGESGGKGPFTTKADIWPLTDVVLLARIQSVDGEYPSSADFDSVHLTVYDQTNGMSVVEGPLSLAPSSVILTLHPYDGTLWPIDREGYNFKYRLSGVTAFPEEHDYKVVIIFTPTDDTTFPLRYELSAEALS